MCKTFPEAKCVTSQCKICGTSGNRWTWPAGETLHMCIGQHDTKIYLDERKHFWLKCSAQNFSLFQQLLSLWATLRLKVSLLLKRNPLTCDMFDKRSTCMRRAWGEKSKALRLNSLKSWYFTLMGVVHNAFISSSVTRLVFSSNTTMVIRLRLEMYVCDLMSPLS